MSVDEQILTENGEPIVGERFGDPIRTLDVDVFFV